MRGMIPHSGAQGPDREAGPLDEHVARRRFDRAAAGFDAHDGLVREIGGRLLERLDLMRIAPRRAVDLGSATGRIAQALLERYPKTKVYAVDWAPAMLARAGRRGGWRRKVVAVCADARRLPLADASVDLIVSNLMLPWSLPPDAVFHEVRRVLSPRGAWLFSTLGPDTLRELRGAFAQADDRPHVHPFMDMHDVGDALMRAGLADPVMDAERLTVTYADLSALLRELRQLGASNALTQRRRGLTAPARLRALEESYPRRADGRIEVTAEIVYGLAWGAPPRRGEGQGREVRIPLSRLRPQRRP